MLETQVIVRDEIVTLRDDGYRISYLRPGGQWVVWVEYNHAEETVFAIHLAESVMIGLELERLSQRPTLLAGSGEKGCGCWDSGDGKFQIVCAKHRKPSVSGSVKP